MNLTTTDKFTRAACYIRVSTDRQEELSPAAQQRLLLDYARTHDMQISPEHIFVENGISGRKAEKRPQFQRMIAMAKTDQPPFCVILVWKFSRFARNQEESIVYKSMLKKQYSVDVISITEPLIEGPFGSLIERIIEWMDEYYSINLSSEVLRGMTEKALRGGCQSAPCLGYRAPGNGLPFEIVPEEAETVQYIFFQFAILHQDAAAIARALNERGITTRRGARFEKRSVIYILRNRFYIGKVMWNGIERDGAQERFLSEELFSLANNRLDAESVSPKRRSSSSCRHWLSGLVKCAFCGASLGYNRGAYPFFQCWKYAKGIHPESCGISEKLLSSAVLAYFEKLLAGTEFLMFPAKNFSAAVHTDEALCQKSLEKLTFREKRIKEAYEMGIDSLTEYQENKRRLLSERARLNALLTSSRNQVTADSAESPGTLTSRIYTMHSFFESSAISSDLKSTFLRCVVEEIIWDKKKNQLSFFLHTL